MIFDLFFSDVFESQNGTGSERTSGGLHPRGTFRFDVNFDHRHDHTRLHINARISRWYFSIFRKKHSDISITRMILSIRAGNDYKKWLPTDGGWGWHVASAISEWVLAIVYCCFLLTFVPEFRLINFEDPVVTVCANSYVNINLAITLARIICHTTR